YFQYYGQLQHQQNMLQDYVRTATYQEAILQNSAAVFREQKVLDVGAGSGILSYFAVQAGAAKVYAVEASDMAQNIRTILEAADPRRNAQPRNPWLHNKVEVINAKMEDSRIRIPQVDVIISEPIGVLLVHERMLESFVLARDRYLKPGGVILPSHGTIHLAPFTDSVLWTETMAKVRFWEQPSFYGVDLNPLFGTALDEYFRMPVVGYFDPRSLLASPAPHGYTVDFSTVTVDELKDFTVPFAWTCRYTGIVHGVAGWFDLNFQPFAATNPRASQSTTVMMSTSPDAARTHWQQVRFVLKEPLAVNAQQVLVGRMHCRVNDKRSYDISITFSLCPPGTDAQDPIPAGCISRAGLWYLHEQTYNYSYNP
ncbi:S-adenosyl-L-methionine-dependent methyltransferase, partial [Dimargaris cristalligena]